jgi:hypothetical protein
MNETRSRSFAQLARRGGITRQRIELFRKNKCNSMTTAMIIASLAKEDAIAEGLKKWIESSKTEEEKTRAKEILAKYLLEK